MTACRLIVHIRRSLVFLPTVAVFLSRAVNSKPCFNQMNIHYETSRSISADEFVGVLRRSTLAERRPVDDRSVIEAMLEHADILCTAWDGEKLVGVARSVTDFVSCCYLSDLAVDEAYQRRGIGARLIEETKTLLGSRAKIILLAAPKAEAYYPRIGFKKHHSAWTGPAV
jgi:GNAT superfamily N-acetyltransferase